MNKPTVSFQSGPNTFGALSLSPKVVSRKTTGKQLGEHVAKPDAPRLAKNVLAQYSNNFLSSSFTANFRKVARTLGGQVTKDLQNWGKPKNPSDAPFDVIDMFCGCGGVSVGFLTINNYVKAFRIIGALDIDPIACKSYEQLGVSPYNEDIRKLSGDKKTLANFLKKSRCDPPKPLILVGCPPCQGFSPHRKKDWKNWNKSDIRNSLVGHFAKVAVKMKPEYIFMENVPDLLSKRYSKYYSDFKNQLENSGYKVVSCVVNMAEYGVPQERYRAIVLASRISVSPPKPFLEPSSFVTVRDSIGHLEEIEPGIPSKKDPLHITAKHKKSTLEVIRAVPKNGGSRPKGIGPKCLDKVNGFSDVYGRLRWDKPSITITGYSRNPASGRYAHPEQDRGLSVREAAILQGFPPYFDFVGSFDEKFLQIGNAVPPLFSAFLAAHILGDLSEAYGTRQAMRGIY